MAGIPTWMDWGDGKPKQITTLEAGGLWLEGNPSNQPTGFQPTMISGTPTHLPFMGPGNGCTSSTLQYTNYDSTKAQMLASNNYGCTNQFWMSDVQNCTSSGGKCGCDQMGFNNGNVSGYNSCCGGACSSDENYLMCRDPSSGLVYGESNQNMASDPRCIWVTSKEILNCCTALGTMFPDANKYCAPDYIPGGAGSYCEEYMVNYCTNNWDDQVCQYYLSNVESIPGAAEVITQVVKNYLTDSSRTPQDYCSSKLKYHQCPVGEKGQDGKPQRDDSTDPFFTTVLPKLCYASPVSCDAILDQFCAQFTRDDLDNLKGDSVLQRMCGCHLSDCQKGQQCHVENQGLTIQNTILRPSQYPFPDVPLQCDPVCNFAETVPRANMQPCQGTVCIIDNLTINQMQSEGNVTISQACGCTAGNCACFIDNVVVNEVNSQGNICVDQSQCGQCYTYSSTNPENPLRLPVCPTNPSCSSKEGFKLFGSKSNWWIWILVALFFVVFALYFFMKKRK